MLTFKPTTEDIWRGQVITMICSLVGIGIVLVFYLPEHKNLPSAFFIVFSAVTILGQVILSAIRIEELKELTTIVIGQNILEGPSGVTLFSNRAKIDISQIIRIDDKLPRWFWPHRIVTTDKSIYIFHHLSNKTVQQILSMIKERKS